MGEVVVITGASGGIGRATARRFARDGASIALLARGRAGLEGAAREVEEHVSPRFLDRYVAKTGYGSQMTDELLNRTDRDNLFEPVDMHEDRRSHGPSDDRAHEHSFQTTLTKHRRFAGSVAAGIGAAATGAALLRRR